jgi:hypothetical protein
VAKDLFTFIHKIVNYAVWEVKKNFKYRKKITNMSFDSNIDFGYYQYRVDFSLTCVESGRRKGRKGRKGRK